MSAVGDWLHGRGLRKAWESGKGVYPSPRCPRLTERLGPRSAVYGGSEAQFKTLKCLSAFNKTALRTAHCNPGRTACMSTDKSEQASYYDERFRGFRSANLLQLERTLGIRMERVQADGTSLPDRTEPRRPIVQRFPLASASGPISGMVRLPGEIMEVQLEN